MTNKNSNLEYNLNATHIRVNKPYDLVISIYIKVEFVKFI